MGPLTLMRRTTEHSELVASASAATTSSPIDRVARFADCLYTDDGAVGDETRGSVSHARPMSPTLRSESFRQKARELREKAKTLKHVERRAEILQIARQYERLAEQVEKPEPDR